ncbi:MAG: hypothetical protein AAFX80_24680, partial [Cyanobacteria bacterium J06639_18]
MASYANAGLRHFFAGHLILVRNVKCLHSIVCIFNLQFYFCNTIVFGYRYFGVAGTQYELCDRPERARSVRCTLAG